MLERHRLDIERIVLHHRLDGGRIACVMPGCIAWYSETLLARTVSEDVWCRYRAEQDEVMEQHLFEQGLERFQKQLADDRKAFESWNRAARAEQDAAATVEFMRRQFPNAVQCPECAAGPVIPENCYELQAHHQEAVRGGHITNA